MPDGHYCSCGNRGCLETVASDIAVLRDLLNADVKVETIEDAIARARDGEPAAVQAFRAMGEALGRGLAVLCNLLNLE
ncbi:ROK family protein [Actinomadura fulvescens]|uniref:Transcriptional regulator n=1 Tax=Actinomadura fulvescens TaxID=46160 RepID=A0ABN3QNQ3_9ACTN